MLSNFYFDFSFDSLVIRSILFRNTWGLSGFLYIFDFYFNRTVVREYIFTVFNFLDIFLYGPYVMSVLINTPFVPEKNEFVRCRIQYMITRSVLLIKWFKYCVSLSNFCLFCY